MSEAPTRGDVHALTAAVERLAAAVDKLVALLQDYGNRRTRWPFQ